ncbi:unnamed protein product [Acanthoscelides obtectus]|uniref:Uncharacterized protein n=1 Tax=Acanthoscelides obtectus TaxID=200917 RepID=A0A9P0K6T2_ACAOB|nr:unnamed protein product [Acanthoscelides obtectus]CAK1631152.1 Ribonucleases P/MRP protein subunit POP1 [Acanthoscelides obtectus]
MSDSNEDGFNVNMRLPTSLTLSKFAVARGREIQIMKNSLSTSTCTKLAFQKLPKHLRRRTMSHNVKRLPRRLRMIHLAQMKKSGLPPKQKRPSRKYRRRPRNLLSEYTRRQRRINWLNTHIWHAKRFHMVEKWGYKLPHCPCDKAFRACYRATTKHCLMQDISYHKCIEISGEFEKLVDSFKKITDPNIGLTIGAYAYKKGSKEGRIVLHDIDNPSKVIGDVSFLWRPIKTKFLNQSVSHLWLWLHPSFQSEALRTIKKCFGFPDVTSDGVQTLKSNDNIQLRENMYDLNRFRLTGPLSTAVLCNAFQLSEKHTVDWLKDFQNLPGEHLLKMKPYWEYLRSVSDPSVLPPHFVLPLIILDPRYNFPKAKTKSLPLKKSALEQIQDPNITDSPLWSFKIRCLLPHRKVSNAKIAEMRQSLLVPGSDLELPPEAIPVILVQRPGVRSNQYNGYSSGWDIILPATYAQPIWLSLIMWGGRPGGLRETDSIGFEANAEPMLSPDTKAGVEEEVLVSNKCKDEFFRLPPNKRTNYNKFRITSPFEFNWKLLLNEWKSSDIPVEDFTVIRDKKVLRQIQQVLSSSDKNAKLPQLAENQLVPVTISLLKKGPCHNFAIICLPESKDFSKEPTEPNCRDSNESKRKQMRKEHKSLLKKLRKRRVRAKRDNKIIPLDKEMLKNYTMQMRKLWLPETKTLRHSCSREVMGFVKQGGFSFLLSKSKGIGYIASCSLEKLLFLKCKNKVLIRNTNSKQYRLGILDVIID